MRIINHMCMCTPIIMMFSAAVVWSQDLVEESSIEIPGSAYSLLPCQDSTADKCLLGYIDGQQGKGGQLKVINKNGDLVYARMTPRFREGWMRSDGDMVLVEHGERDNSFKVSRLTLSGNVKREMEISGIRSSDEFDYNAAGNGDLFAVNTDTVVYLDGNIRQRPQAWKDSVLPPVYWYLLPDASIIVSSGRARKGEKEETARIDINGKIIWRSPKALMLPGHAERRAAGMPKYMFAWGQDNGSLSLVSIENGEAYWDITKSADQFGVSLIGVSPSQRFIVLSVAAGRPKLDLVIADTQRKEIVARKRMPEGLKQIAFDSAEERVFALCKIWRDRNYRKEILKKRDVPAKLRIIEFGLDLQEKAKAYELDVVSGKLGGERLVRLSSDRLGVMDPSSGKIRVIKSHE